MKKILFLITVILTLALNASAQSDSFFKSDVNSGHRDVEIMPHAPAGELGHIPDSEVPLGSGLLIMTALGCACVLRKKLKDN